MNNRTQCEQEQRYGKEEVRKCNQLALAKKRIKPKQLSHQFIAAFSKDDDILGVTSAHHHLIFRHRKLWEQLQERI